MGYPESMPCGQWSPNMASDSPCDGRTRRYVNAPLLINNNKGPWYGCTKCGRLCQYQDVLDGRFWTNWLTPSKTIVFAR